MMNKYEQIFIFLNKPTNNSISWNEIMEAYMKIYRIELPKVKSLDELEVFHNQLAVKKLNGLHDFKMWTNSIENFCDSWLRLAVP